MVFAIVRDLMTRRQDEGQHSLTWSSLFSAISGGAIIFGTALALIFIASLVLYAVTAYVGPTVFRTGPWRRSADDRAGRTTGYGRTLTPTMLELTGTVTKAIHGD